MDIQLDQLLFRWPQSAFRLEIPSLQISSGESVAVLGPSGSGKTSFLRLLAGLLLPHQGSIRLGACELQRMSESDRRLFRQKHIGFVFQDFRLIEYLNVRENILSPWRLMETHAPPAEAVVERLERLADALGLKSLLDRSVGHLSHGERQRAAIARALLLEPGLLLADEPTGNLDPSNKQRVRDMLLKETGRQQTSLIMVTHDRELVAGFDRVIDFASLQQAAAS